MKKGENTQLQMYYCLRLKLPTTKQKSLGLRPIFPTYSNTGFKS